MAQQFSSRPQLFLSPRPPGLPCPRMQPPASQGCVGIFSSPFAAPSFPGSLCSMPQTKAVASPALAELLCQGMKRAGNLGKNTTDSHCSHSEVGSFSGIRASQVGVFLLVHLQSPQRVWASSSSFLTVLGGDNAPTSSLLDRSSIN